SRSRAAWLPPTSLGLVLFVGNLLQPLDGLAVELLLDGEVRHRRGRGGAVPVLLAGREPDNVAGADLLDRPAPALAAADAAGHDQRLAERVGVPGGAGAGFEGDAGPGDAGRRGRREQRVDADRAGEPIRRPL